MKCWIAPRDITPGTEWGAAIVDGIDRSRVMVLIFSANANQSPQVRREVERAISKSIPILPLRIEDIRPQGSLEFALSNTHWLDAFAAPADERLTQLAESVMALLGVKQEPKTRTQSVPVLPVTRTQRFRIIKVAAVVAVAFAAIIGLAYWKFAGPDSGTSKESGYDPTTISADSTELRTSPSGATAEDETVKLQGHWVAVAESTQGRLHSSASVKERDYSLTIEDHSVSHRRHPTSTETATLAGYVEFKKDDETYSFIVRGTGNDGVRRIWLGLYRLSGNELELCYRESEGRGLLPVAPSILNTNGLNGTHYVKLVRQRGRRKR